MSIPSIAKTLTDFTQNLIKVTEEGINLQLRPHTDAEQLKWEQDVRNVWSQGTHDVSDEAASDAREHATKHLIDGGMSEQNAKKLVEQQLKKVVDLGEQARKAIPKIGESAKLGWLKFVGAITALLAGGVIVATVTSGPSSEQMAMYKSLQHEAVEQEQLQRFLISEGDFNMMTGGLFVQSAPSPQEIPTALAAAAAPVAITAIAEEPAQVELANSSGTQNVMSTVGQVYLNAPQEVRREMARSASEPAPMPKIDHGYDHENFNDCAHTHCLSSPHKEFTVNSGFASIHVKY